MRSIRNFFSAVGGALMTDGRMDRAIAESHLRAMMYVDQPLPRM